MARRYPSVRNLPEGKMQELKDMFEKKDLEASGATLFGISPPKTGDKTVILRRAHVSGNAIRAKSTVLCDSPWKGNLEANKSAVRNSTGQFNVLREKVPAQPNLHKDTGEQDWTTFFARRAAAKRLSSSVSRHMSRISESDAGEEKAIEKPSLETRFASPVTRESGGGFLAKQDATDPGQNISTISNEQHCLGKSSSDINNSSTSKFGFESGMSSEKFQIKHGHEVSAEDTSNILKNGQHADAKPVRPSSKSELSKQAVELAPPPRKPPRTFAHDEYLEIKRQGMSPVGIQNVQKVTKKQPEEFSGSKTKNGMFIYDNNNADQKDMSKTGGSQDLHSLPPRLRAISEASALQKNKDFILAQNKGGSAQDKDGSDSESDGPVVISLKYKRRLDHRASVAGPQRQPWDQLPELPKQVGFLQQGAMHKSFSSECINKIPLLTVLDSEGEEKADIESGYSQRDWRQNQYETLIDNIGYSKLHNFRHNHVDRDSQEEMTGPPISAATPVTEQDVDKVAQGKLNLVRKKINQAYEQLYLSSDLTNDDETDDSWSQTDSADGDSTVDAVVITKRVRHCSTVRMKTSQYVRRSKEFMEKVYPQLYEYALIVGLAPKTDDLGFKPYIIYKHPEYVENDAAVPKFCFPDADGFRLGLQTDSESYSFVLTKLDGERLYGYCRRIQPPDTKLPEVICIVSPVDAFNMYNQLLAEIEIQRLISGQHAEKLLAASFQRPLPSPGKACKIFLKDDSGERKTFLINRPPDHRLASVNYECLLWYLGTENLIKVFSSMLMERRLILFSKHLSVLTQTIHALVAVLYPFSWQHVYIPLLPQDMLDVCAAPMPFLIGILQHHLAQVVELELEEVVIVDLDQKKMVQCEEDEHSLLPKKVQKALKTAINMCKIDSDTINSQWLMVSEAFLRMFLETVGHFSQYVCIKNDGTKIFLKEKFKAGVQSKGIRQFLEWFTETQMFEVFINTQLLEQQNVGGMDLFTRRLSELHSRRVLETKNEKRLGQKVIDFGKAIKTKFKDTK